jgi:hypothetical protein
MFFSARWGFWQGTLATCRTSENRPADFAPQAPLLTEEVRFAVCDRRQHAAQMLQDFDRGRPSLRKATSAVLRSRVASTIIERVRPMPLPHAFPKRIGFASTEISHNSHRNVVGSHGPRGARPVVMIDHKERVS